MGRDEKPQGKQVFGSQGQAKVCKEKQVPFGCAQGRLSTARNDPRRGSFRFARDDNFGMGLSAPFDFPFALLRASAKQSRLKMWSRARSLPSFARLDNRGRLSLHEPSNFKDAVHRRGLLRFGGG
jgi:hypothetical protein